MTRLPTAGKKPDYSLAKQQTGRTTVAFCHHTKVVIGHDESSKHAKLEEFKCTVAIAT